MLEPLVRPVTLVARQTVAVSGHVFKHARAISIRDTVSLLVKWLQSLLRAFVDAGHLIIRFYRALERSALWVIHLPKIVATTISQWISRTGRTIADVCQAVKAAIQVILRGIVLGFKVVLSLLLLYIVVLATRYVYRIYRRKRELQIQRKLHEQLQRKEAERLARIAAEAEGRQARQGESQKRQEEQKKHKEMLEAQRLANNDQMVYRQWLGQCEVLLSCRETMTRFPDPPFWLCSFGCRPVGVLQACPHSVTRLYQAAGVQSIKQLMKERLRWHPDKFERCPESARDQLKTKATEMFQIIQVLLGDG
jgi:hypothetical protein